MSSTAKRRPKDVNEIDRILETIIRVENSALSSTPNQGWILTTSLFNF